MFSVASPEHGDDGDRGTADDRAKAEGRTKSTVLPAVFATFLQLVYKYTVLVVGFARTDSRRAEPGK